MVPEVIASSLARRNTLSALNSPTCAPPGPRSAPACASANATQKPTSATQSSRDQLCRRYGTFRTVIACARATLNRNGSASPPLALAPVLVGGTRKGCEAVCACA